MSEQNPQIGLQIVPTGRTVHIRGQQQRIVPAHAAHVLFTGFARTERRLRIGGHGGQLQAVIAQLDAPRLRHTAPQRHRQAIPCAQPPLEPGGRRIVQTQPTISVGFDLALGQGHDGHIARLTVQAESGQLGIVGMRGDDQHAALGIIRVAHREERRLAG